MRSVHLKAAKKEKGGKVKYKRNLLALIQKRKMLKFLKKMLTLFLTLCFGSLRLSLTKRSGSKKL